MFSSIEKEMNTLFYSTTPIRMHQVILTGSPWWLTALLAFMKLFMSRKMGERIVNTTVEDMVVRIGGPSFLPKGIANGNAPVTFRYAGPGVEDEAVF